LGLLSQDVSFWSVFVNDLRIIADLIETPSQFFHFLQRRLRANDFPEFNTTDELDFLMFYFSEGLYFEDGITKGTKRVMPYAYTEDIDRYYDFLAGRVSSGTKPAMKCSNRYKNLIRQIEATGKRGFTATGSILFGLDTETQQKITEHIDLLRRTVRQDGRDHDFTMLFSRESFGLSCFVFPPSSSGWARIDGYVELKMYQTRYRSWLAIQLSTVSDNDVDFKFYDSQWAFNPELEKRLVDYSSYKVEKSRAKYGKIGRNESCPCGSGKKYKRCCGA